MRLLTASRAAPPLAALVLALAAAPAWSQARSQDFGAYTLRSSTVNSQTLSPESAREHGIERDPRVAVLNVTVLKNEQGGVGRTVPARVQARTTSLAGVINELDMRETRFQDWVSYTGTYAILPRQVVDVTITALPEGSSEPLTMTYRERMWANVEPAEPEPFTR